MNSLLYYFWKCIKTHGWVFSNRHVATSNYKNSLKMHRLYFKLFNSTSPITKWRKWNFLNWFACFYELTLSLSPATLHYFPKFSISPSCYFHLPKIKMLLLYYPQLLTNKVWKSNHFAFQNSKFYNWQKIDMMLVLVRPLSKSFQGENIKLWVADKQKKCVPVQPSLRASLARTSGQAGINVIVSNEYCQFLTLKLTQTQYKTQTVMIPTTKSEQFLVTYLFQIRLNAFHSVAQPWTACVYCEFGKNCATYKPLRM